MKDFFAFRSMLAPTLIRILYFLGALLIIVFAIMAFVRISNGQSLASGFSSEADFSADGDFSADEGGNSKVGSILLLIVSFIVAEILWRVMCECAIIPFAIHEDLCPKKTRSKK